MRHQDPRLLWLLNSIEMCGLINSIAEQKYTHLGKAATEKSECGRCNASNSHTFRMELDASSEMLVVFISVLSEAMSTRSMAESLQVWAQQLSHLWKLVSELHHNL